VCRCAQEATKQQIALSPQRHFRGYQGLGANVTRYDGGFARDHHEGIDFYKDVTVCLSPFKVASFSPMMKMLILMAIWGTYRCQAGHVVQ
jgi:hypothetical protein